MTELQTRQGADVIESVIIKGDLGQLTPQERVAYYGKVCESLGLNPYTQPFRYLNLNGKLTLYADKGCTDQLRESRKVSVEIKSRERFGEDVYIVTAKATLDGRTDESIGAVNIGGLKGDALANALMKAETKAKRRVTLSICGLGFTDETEVETIPGARTVVVDSTTGEIQPTQPQIEAPKAEATKTDPHWATNQKTLAAWWPWVKAQGLTNVECHKALGVEHLAQYEGSEAEARKAITDFVARNSA